MIQFIHTTANPYSGYTRDNVSKDNNPLHELKMADISGSGPSGSTLNSKSNGSTQLSDSHAESPPMLGELLHYLPFLAQGLLRIQNQTDPRHAFDSHVEKQACGSGRVGTYRV